MTTVTSRYGFKKPEITDNMSPTPFNENFDKVESVLEDISLDYIVAYGKQGVWDYRRWSSGIAECWIEKYTVSKVAMTSAWGTTGNPIYRLYNPNSGDHMFTENANEKNSLVKAGWTSEGYLNTGFKIYTCSIASPGNYPLTFKSAPLVIPSFTAVANNTYSFPVWAIPNNSTTACPKFQGIHTTSGTISSLSLGIYVKGRWK